MKKLVMLLPQYGPYHFARIEGLQTQSAELGTWQPVGLEVARLSSEYPWMTDLQDCDVPIVSIMGNHDVEKVPLVKTVLMLFNQLNKLNPDVIAVSGYSRITMLSVILWSKFNNCPLVLFAESKEDDAPRKWWIEKFKSLIISNYHAALVGGISHKEYLIKLGFAPDSIRLGYDAVDNKIFAPSQENFPVKLEKPYFLVISRFVPKKNLKFVIAAYHEYFYRTDKQKWDLVICGDGDLRPEIEQQIADLNLQKFIHLPGFLQQDEVIGYLHGAKCFIHASLYEQWGLVVNEAMSSGLPVLVSNRCGCFPDLVIDGETGYGFNPENIEELITLMLKISSDEINLEHIKKSALIHIQKFSTDRFGKNLLDAAEYALSKKK